MPSIRVSQHLKDSTYFITMTVKNWYYLFDRHNRWQLLADSLKYCQENKGLNVYGYVFMLNHAHLLIQSPDAGGFIRDFKRHIARIMLNNLHMTEPRVAKLFKTKEGGYEFWEKTNMPILIESEEMYYQKLDYIHNNPVKKAYVNKPEHWVWSSASWYHENQTGPIQISSFG